MKDEWQSRCVGVVGGGCVDWQSASKRFEMAVRPMANGKDSKISCHFADACIPGSPAGFVQGVMRVSCTLDQEVLQVHKHECSGANRSAESRPADSRRETMKLAEDDGGDDDD